VNRESHVDTQQITARARKALGTALQREVGDRDFPERPTEVGWDSIKHVELVLLLEEEFDVRFGEDEIPSLDSLGAIVNAVERHLASHDHNRG